MKDGAEDFFSRRLGHMICFFLVFTSGVGGAMMVSLGWQIVLVLPRSKTPSCRERQEDNVKKLASHAIHESSGNG